MSDEYVQQAPHRLGLLGLHEAEQLARTRRRAGRRSRSAASSGSISSRTSAARSVVEVAQQVLLLGVGSSSSTSARRSSPSAVGDVVAAPLRQVHQRVGDVGGPHVLERGQQPARCPARLRERQSPITAAQGSTCTGPRRPSRPTQLAHGEARDQPVAAALVLHEDVDDLGVGVVVDHADAGVEHLADDEHLVGALGERAQVDLTRWPA